MQEELAELVIAPAETDADLEALIAVRQAVDPRAHPKLENLRHARDSSTSGLVFLVGRISGGPVACGFIEASSDDFAEGDISVIPDRRRRGIGSALLARISAHAKSLGKDSRQLEVRKSDEASRRFLAHRGFTAVKRAWRRRGVATALKRAQIAGATELGLERLVTASEERNLPMRSLNEKLGYRPDSGRSTVVMRGPLQA